MFPGYVSIYKDKESYVHLFFFPGIDDNGQHIYKDIDFGNCTIEYTMKHDKDARDYRFDSKKIKRIVCKLVDMDGNEHRSLLNV